MKIRAKHTDATMKVAQAIAEIGSHAELQAIYDAAGERWKRLSAQKAATFKMGDQIAFEHGRYGTVRATVLSVGADKVKAIDTRGMHWTCEVSTIRRVEKPSDNKVPTVPSDVR